MNFDRRASQVSSRFVGKYSKLFQGLTPAQISPHEDTGAFFSTLLGLDVDQEYLEGQLNQVPKDTCLGTLKPFLNALFRECLTHARTAPHDDTKKRHSLETLSILVRCVLGKNLTGWEVMEILASGVGQSDTVFMDFTALVNDTLVDQTCPGNIRHLVLQLALIYMCGVSQLSPGAYFLRRDLFPSIVTFITSPDTEQFTFEAVLLLAILANYHKSDAAKLNPYLKRIAETRDEQLMRKICWSSNFALDAAVKAYQQVSDDSISPTLTSTLGSIIASWRPDRALSSAPTNPPRELFKNHPIEACVVLLPVFEFLRGNPAFSSILLEYRPTDEASKPGRIPPLSSTILSLSSYLLTHATSTSSPRSIAYADLSLHILLAFVECDELMEALCQPATDDVRLCRQRLPVLPIPRAQRPPVCALLDCCILWLRHNLHKRLEVSSYINCIYICYRIIWYLQRCQIRLEYHWKELWTAIFGLLDFVTTKINDLHTTGRVEQLIRETVLLLDLSLSKSGIYLPSPRSLHEFIYELVRSSSVLKKQESLLHTLAIPQAASRISEQPTDVLVYILGITTFYEDIVAKAGARTAKEAMRCVAKSIEGDGLHGADASRGIEPLKRSEDVLGFARYACMDGMSLMP